MKPVSFLLGIAVVIGICLVIYVALQKPEVRSEVRELGNDVERGARDSYDAGKRVIKDVVP